MGQSASNKLSDQQLISFFDLALPGFPIVEFRPLWKIIWQTNSTYANTPKARIAEVYDIRELSTVGVGSLAVSDHGVLTGLADDDHLQYVHISEPRTISANHTITGNTTFSGGIKDSQESLGLAGQYLSSTGTGVEWKFPATTNVVFVSKNGNDQNSGSSLQNPKLTIKSALETATAGTVIKVSAGTYVEDNPLIIPSQVSIVGDSLREVSVSPANLGDLFYVENGCYVANMSFIGSANSGAIFSFNSANPPFVTQSPYIQNCTNFIPNSTGILIDGNNAIGPLKSMVVDSYTQYNQNGFGVILKNQAYAQLVSIFTICCDTAIICESGSACDLTNSNSSFGNYGFIADGVSSLKYTGITTESNIANTNVFQIDLSTDTYNISDAIYDNTTGILTVYTTQPHNFSVGMSIELNGLEFSCEDSPPNLIYPSGNNGYVFEIKTVQSMVFTVNVGTSTLEHTYVSGGTVKLNVVRPFDGQVVYLNDLYYLVDKINILSGGSGYTTVPTVTISPPPTDWGVQATAVANILNGSVVSIEIISSGRGYITPPTITISNPNTGSDAAIASIEVVPKYYSIINSSPISESGICTITLSENVPYEVNLNLPVYFFKQSRILASGHSFEYIGSGTDINTALPSVGGVPIQDNETTAINGGLVVFTSTDQSGNFRIGDGVVINQQTGTISGTFYSKSLFSTMTPFILALGGN